MKFKSIEKEKGMKTRNSLHIKQTDIINLKENQFVNPSFRAAKRGADERLSDVGVSDNKQFKIFTGFSTVNRALTDCNSLHIQETNIINLKENQFVNPSFRAAKRGADERLSDVGVSNSKETNIINLKENQFFHPSFRAAKRGADERLSDVGVSNSMQFEIFNVLPANNKALIVSNRLSWQGKKKDFTEFVIMKCAVILLATILFPLLSRADNTAQALFEKGNAAYAKAQYKDALADYQQVLSKGSQSAALYFNLGNAWYKNGDVDEALLYYEKAHKLSPGDEDINFNIRFVNLKTTDKIDESAEFFLTKWWRSFILSMSTNALAWLAVSLFLAASATWILYFLTGSVIIKKTSFYTFILLFVLGLFACIIANRQVNYFDDHKEAIIFSNSVNIQSGPNTKSAVLFILHDGTKVNVMEKVNGWLRIKLVNGNVGWLKASDVKAI